MACATLKRSLDWDSLNQRPTKRRRCNPFGNADKSHSRSLKSTSMLSSSDSIYTSRSAAETYGQEKKSSVFQSAEVREISQDKMAQRIRDEIKRLHKRKELLFATINDRMQDSESSGSEMGLDSPRRPESPANIGRNPDKALFTFKQVQLICERMLKEKEEEMREKYDAILTSKLAEQYDAFVKFTYDQIQRRYEAAPSYLS